MPALLSKEKAVNAYIVAKAIDEAGGTTLQMDKDHWILATHSGVFHKTPKEAGKIRLRRAFGEEMAKDVEKIVDDLGEKASVETVREAVKQVKKSKKDEEKGEKSKIPSFKAKLVASTLKNKMRRPFSPVNLGEITLARKSFDCLVDSGYDASNVKTELIEINLAATSSSSSSSSAPETMTTTLPSTTEEEKSKVKTEEGWNSEEEEEDISSQD